MHLLLAYLPIAFLVFLMTKPKSMPSFQALPLTASIAYLIVFFVFKQPFNLVNAALVDGMLTAWTPITIIAGAIFLFRTMEITGALATVKTGLNSISENPIAQLMIVGWAFQFLIEGASGFGTPAAIAAPVLVGLGFPAIRVAIFCLILNSVPVSFGAVGTPTWFGFSLIDLSTQEISTIATKTALLNSAASFAVVFGALLFLMPFDQVKRNSVFILLSILSCVLPYLAIATLSYEFPALLGGLIGLVTTIVFAKYGVGLEKLAKIKPTQKLSEALQPKTIIKATFPLWGTVALLVLTRVPQLGIKPLLQLSEPAFVIELGAIGTLSLSAALVLSFNNILNTSESWSHALLYVPSLLPFIVVSLITLKLYPGTSSKTVAILTYEQMKKPIIALSGALVFVSLMMVGGDQAIVNVLGNHMASLSGQQWPFFSAFLGALGSFFSGSATISNLTFGAIQASIGSELSLDITTVLALQSAGAAMGNMVCVANIVAVATILNLGNQEGYVLKRTAIIMIVYGVLLGVLSIPLSLY